MLNPHTYRTDLHCQQCCIIVRLLCLLYHPPMLATRISSCQKITKSDMASDNVDEACFIPGCGMIFPSTAALLHHMRTQCGHTSNLRNKVSNSQPQPPSPNNLHKSTGTYCHLGLELKKLCSLLDGKLFGQNNGLGYSV
jgi:hypothetical protein